ncbi:MAG: UvrD-helicase domain-containing protein [Verrucomicrobiales bacterium]
MAQHVLQNEMILASAGAGKTYQLTDRYVALMARGVEPERIIALTFTRKAAGEFFDSILVKLATAAASPEGARLLATSLQLEELTQLDFQAMLRKLAKRLHLLSLGTLDGFFVSIIRNFPFEFGLGGGFEILDEHLISLEKGRVYRKVFQRARTRQQEQRDFLDAFKLATFGSEGSTLLKDLNHFVDDHHEIFLGAPAASQWGNPDTIWPDGSQWLEEGHALPCDLVREADALRHTLDFGSFNQKQQDRWDEFLNELETYSPGVPLPSAISYLLPKLLDVYPELEAGEAILTVYKKQVLQGDACAILERIVRAIVGRELENKLRQTRGIWMVLNQYEQTYSRLVRRRGKLTFYDLQLVLGGGENLEHQRPMLTQRPGTRERLRIDYRLDTRYDHWLLDEFQDTSYLQWSVIENLIDEAVQDQSGQRSLFQVGDLKQAIYAWRGGDVTLFDEIRDHYNRDGEEERIIQRPLNDSWRSGPAVIELVNTVFGNDQMLRYLLPSSAIDRWRWGPHVSRHPDLNGYSCFLQPTSDAYGNSADDQTERRLDLMLDILREVDPARRGLSCAVLVQTNKAGQQVVDWIRAHSDIQVISESFVRIAEDNPASSALLDLLQFAAHPGDTFAWQHLMMTPFAQAMDRPGWTREKLIFEILDEAHRHGFESVVSSWSQRLEEFVPGLDAFSRRRLEMLGEAARGFDSSGSRSISDFIAFARDYAIREPASQVSCR